MSSNVDQFIAGGVGGMAGVIAGHPLDTMKVRIQCAPGKLGMGDCLRQIVREHGLRGLYRGMATPIAFATPVCAIAFSGKSWADANLLRGEISARKAFLSGCVGGATSALLACPSERVKVVLQNNPSIKTAVQRGLTFTILRDTSGYAAYFTTIFYCQRHFDQMGISPIVASFVAGGLAGMVLWVWGLASYCSS